MSSTSSPRSFWRETLYGWLVVAIVLIVDLAWLHYSRHAVSPASLMSKAKTVGMLTLGGLALVIVGRIPRYRTITTTLRYRETTRTLACYALLVSFLGLASILSYLCVTVDAPLIDGSLARFDQALGFDWPALYRWTRSHPDLHAVLAFVYRSAGWQLVLIPAILGLSRRNEELSDYVFLLMTSLILVLVISTPFPAAGAFIQYRVSDPQALASVSHFPMLRDGTLRIFDLGAMQGLVSIPSFHTVLAVLFVFALRKIPLLFWCSVVLNTMMVASTPTEGGHYLADVIAGWLLAALCIGLLIAVNRLRAARARPLFGDAVTHAAQTAPASHASHTSRAASLKRTSAEH